MQMGHAEVSDVARHTTVNHMACLRESYASQDFSCKASDLILASWRVKMIPTMVPSLLNGLVSAMESRSSFILNFLAGLFSEGY